MKRVLERVKMKQKSTLKVTKFCVPSAHPISLLLIHHVAASSPGLEGELRFASGQPLWCFQHCISEGKGPCVAVFLPDSRSGCLVTEEKVAQSRPTHCDPTGCRVHGILQTKILEWVAFPFFKGSSQTRD